MERNDPDESDTEYTIRSIEEYDELVDEYSERVAVRLLRWEGAADGDDAVAQPRTARDIAADVIADSQILYDYRNCTAIITHGAAEPGSYSGQGYYDVDYPNFVAAAENVLIEPLATGGYDLYQELSPNVDG